LSGLLAEFSDEADEADEAVALSPAELKLAVGGGAVSCILIPVRGGNKSTWKGEIIGLSRLSAASAEAPLVWLSAASAEVPLVWLSAASAQVPLFGLSADDDASDMMVETCGEIMQTPTELGMDDLSKGDVPPKLEDDETSS
jgi:hypothetical protein